MAGVQDKGLVYNPVLDRWVEEKQKVADGFMSRHPVITGAKKAVNKGERNSEWEYIELACVVCGSVTLWCDRLGTEPLCAECFDKKVEQDYVAAWRDYCRLYYVEHRNEVLERMRRFYVLNHNDIRERRRELYWRNIGESREYVRQAGRRFYGAKRDECLARVREYSLCKGREVRQKYRDEHRDDRREYNRVYYDGNRDVILEQKREYYRLHRVEILNVVNQRNGTLFGPNTLA